MPCRLSENSTSGSTPSNGKMTVNNDLAGHATVQVANRRLLTAAVWVRSQVRSRGFCGGQNGTGAGFLQVIRFPLPILIPPNAPYSRLSSEAGTIGALVAEVPRRLSLTPPPEVKARTNRLLRPRREADHSPPTSAEVKNAWIYTSTPPYVFMA
jgi:hypothetical protein